MQTIATRRYFCHGIEQQLVDRMVRKPCGSFVLIEGPEKPGDLEVEKPYSLEHVFEWLQEYPWQIERAVIVNEATTHCRQT
jgi:hypothetical protein